MDKSRSSAHLRDKSSSSSTAKIPGNSQVRRAPRSPIPSPENASSRKTLVRTSSDISRPSKTQQQQQQQSSTATAAKRLPANKPIEKPKVTTSIPAQRTHTPPTPKSKTTLKSNIASSSSQKPAVSSKPTLDKSSKTTTANTVKRQTLCKSHSSGSLLQKRKDANASSTISKAEVPLVVAPQYEEEQPNKAENIELTEVPALNTVVHDELADDNSEPNTSEFASETDVDHVSEHYESISPVPEPKAETVNAHDEIDIKLSEVEENNKNILISESSEVKPTPENVEEPNVEQSNSESKEVEVEPKVALVAETNTEEKAAVEAVSTETMNADKDTVEKEADATAMKPLTVSKKTEVVQGKRTETPISNAVIEETRSKLLEERKSKVKALVGAFETVMS